MKWEVICVNVLDLTHTISDAMPLWPGTPQVQLTPLSDYASVGCRETLLSISSHTGTHIDAPAHLFPQGPTLDSLNPSQFAGNAIVLNCQNRHTISLSLLQSYAAALDRVEFLLFYTGWSRYWQTPDYFGDYPTLSEDAARYLAARRLKGIGVDAISFDPFMDAELPIHKILLGSGMILIENLRNLKALPGKEFFLTAAPLKIRNADGAPARVLAIL